MLLAKVVACFGLVLVGLSALALGTAATLPAATSAFLGRFVNAEPNVNYAAIKHNPAQLQGPLASVCVQPTMRKVRLSRIFKWYEADFKASGKTNIAYVNQFREGRPIPALYAVECYSYD